MKQQGWVVATINEGHLVTRDNSLPYTSGDNSVTQTRWREWRRFC